MSGARMIHLLGSSSLRVKSPLRNEKVVQKDEEEGAWNCLCSKRNRVQKRLFTERWSLTDFFSNLIYDEFF